MSTISFSVFIVLCMKFLVIVIGDSHISTSTESHFVKSYDADDSKADLDIQRRKEIAKNYLDTLARAKETWVDPYDMIAYPVDERQSVPPHIPEESSTASIFNEPNTDSDYRPLFSDIRGEVIGPNSTPKDDSDDFHNKGSGKLLSNGRHQICVLDSIYISRWLKKLIAKIESDSELEPTAVTIPLNSESLIDIKTMSTAKTLEIADLDEMMCNLIGKATISRKESYDWTVFKLYASDFGMGFCILVACCLFIYCFYLCLVKRPVLTLIWCFIIISILWHWMHLYQKQIAIKHSQLGSMQMPPECRKNEFGLLDHIHSYFKSYFAEDGCVKYYEALMVNPFWEVSLSVAASEAVTAMLFQPLYSASKAINASVKLLFDGLSFFSMIILIGFLFILIIMLCNYRLRLPFFMGALEPSNARHNYVEDVRSPMTYNILRDESYRVAPSIQDSSFDRKLALRQDVSTGLFRNECISRFDSSVFKSARLNGSQSSNSKKYCEVEATPKSFSELTCAESKKSHLSDSNEGTESAEEIKSCSCCEDDIDSVENVKGDKHPAKHFHTVKSSSKCKTFSETSKEQMFESDADEEDNSCENICDTTCNIDDSRPNTYSHISCATCEVSPD